MRDWNKPALNLTTTDKTLILRRSNLLMVARLPWHYVTSRIVRTSMHGGRCKRQLLITRHLVQGQHPVLVFTRLCLDSRPNTGYSDTRCIVNFLSSSMKYSMTASFQSFHSITDAHLQVTHYGKFTSGTALLNEYRNTQRSKTCSFT